jgi:predicted transcriptional regulator
VTPWRKGQSNRSGGGQSTVARRRDQPAQGPGIEQIVTRARVSIVNELIQGLQGIEPLPFAKIERRSKAAAKLPRQSAERLELAALLRQRRELAGRVRAVISEHRPFLEAMQDAFLPEHGIVGRECTPVGERRWIIAPEPLQHHLHRGPIVAWNDTIFNCAARCQVAGSECIEPAILAAIRVLHGLRDLAPDAGLPTADLSKVFDRHDNLRSPARQFLKALDEPARKLDELARRLDRDEVYVRKFSKPLQSAGLIRARPDGSWARTVEGTQALKR